MYTVELTKEDLFEAEFRKFVLTKNYTVDDYMEFITTAIHLSTQDGLSYPKIREIVQKVILEIWEHNFYG